MKIFKFKYMASAAVIALSSLGMTSCVGDLDVDNINPQQVSELNTDALFNKVYSNMVLTGQVGPNGSGDLDDIDEGTSSMIRQLWNANELTTDEAKCVWGDAGIPEFNHNSWSDNHPMMKALYYRFYFGITLSNFFLEKTEGATDANTLTMRAEVRFMRAMDYYFLMDLYGNIPFLTTVTSELAPQYSRAEVFEFCEKELKDIVGEGEGNEILADKAPKYGRAPKAAAYMLLSRLYLNSEVYTGTAKWAEAKTYAEKVLQSGYDILTQGTTAYSPFQLLFMGDNDRNGAQNEIILPAIHDGKTTQTWGGCLFIIAASCNDKIKESYPYGTTENWGGNHCTPKFVEKFFPSGEPGQGLPTDITEMAGDSRALFYNIGHTLDINKESDFTSGYAYVKFSNLHSDGTTPGHTQFVDTDFPMFRAAEAYLNIAEADARLNGNKCTAEGLAKINAIRSRANATTLTSCNLDQICDEWAREFAFEGRRRIDLIRFNKFGGQTEYKWQWMGGTKDGAPFDKHFNIFPIPNSDLNANSNLKQNPGY